MCIRQMYRLSRTFLVGALLYVAAATSGAHDDAGKPGEHRLRISTHAAVCTAVGRALTSNGLSEHSSAKLQRVHWIPARAIDRGDVDAPIVETRIDINNDGLPDRVIKIEWRGGARTDRRS